MTKTLIDHGWVIPMTARDVTIEDGAVAIEDRETRTTFVWDPAARRDIKLATAAMLEVGSSLHLVTDGTVFRWDAAAQRWHAAPK